MGFGVKKLSYYTYRLMTEKLEGSDWDNNQTVQEYDGVHVYRFLKNGRPVWVAWDDKGITCVGAPCGRQVTIPGILSNKVKITEAVPYAVSGAYLDENDYPYFFETETRPVINGQVTIIFGESPVFVEAADGG